MLITYLRSKGVSIGAVSCLIVASFATLASELPWFEARGGEVVLKKQFGGRQVIKVPVEVKGVFLDDKRHYVGMHEYFSVFQVADSSPGNPEGVCGSGEEVWLQIMRSSGELSSKILVSSCLESFSLASQNTGLEGQDDDFSSIKWGGKGFSIEWFGRKDRSGRLLSPTYYRECGELFCAVSNFD